jgi:ADP-ribose pyrophosphatase
MKAPIVLHRTRWLNLLQRDNWVFASRQEPGEVSRIDAVNVVASHEDAGRQRLVVTEEWRAAIAAWEFSVPAGLIDPGETPQQCASRELTEETGLTATWMGSSSGRLYSSAGVTDESFVFIFCGCTGSPALQPGINGERIRVHLLDRAGCRDLLARNATGAILSGRLWPFLFSAAKTGRIGAHAIT